MFNKKSNDTHEKKVREAAMGGEIVKLDREDHSSHDHRDRPHNQYSEEFKRRVAAAAAVSGVKLTWVGLRFNVLPDMVQVWRDEYSDK